jgi:hypothetical protein
LAAEHVGDGQFKVTDLSVQRTGGGLASFVRDPSTHRRFIRHFLARTGHRYDQFNYLGEWHSHPSFPVDPSIMDLRQMQSLIEDRGQQAHFLVLLVMKLGRRGNLEGSAHAFRRGQLPVRARLHVSRQVEVPQGSSALRRSLKDAVALRCEKITLRRTG